MAESLIKSGLENIRQSRLARESSKFDDYLRREYEAMDTISTVECQMASVLYLSADDGSDEENSCYVNSEGHG